MLSVSDLVNVSINLSPLAAARRSFGVLLIGGDSNVISGLERFRTYTTLASVATDFGTSAPEYLSAALYFGQTPRPKTLMIGRWLRTASSGFNQGGTLTAAQQLTSAWTGITTGAFKITIDGTLRTLSSLNFSAITNMNGVASVINTAVSSWASCTWNGSQLVITSNSTGTSSIVTAAIAPSSGVDISAQIKMTAGTLTVLVPGYASEAPVDFATALANLSPAWYGLVFAASTLPTDNQNLAVSDLIEAQTLSRIFGVTSIDPQTLVSTSTTDLAYLMKAAGYKQSFIQYSLNVYAIASMFGRAFSVDFAANRSVITLMFKQEPSVTPENLTESQALILKGKNCNVFVSYVNSTNIIQFGVMSAGNFFDEIHGLDWFQDAVQNACYNVLYQSTTKVPQTDAGANQLTTAIASACEEAVNNGLVAPGTWNADGFGQLNTGDFLKSGFYIFAQPMALQSQADRETRVAPPIQVALKLAGAIQSLNVTVNVNR